MRNRSSIPILRGISITILSIAIVLVIISLIGYSRQRNNYPAGMTIAGVHVGGVDPQIANGADSPRRSSSGVTDSTNRHEHDPDSNSSANAEFADGTKKMVQELEQRFGRQGSRSGSESPRSPGGKG